MADVSVRPARTEDVAEIARIQIDTWRVAYADVLPPSVRDGLSVDAATEAWRAAVDTPPGSGYHLVVALEGEWRVGFAAFGPAADSDDTPPADASTTIAVSPLLVEPRWGRRGHGSRLLAATVDIARRDGMTRAVTWIPEQDAASKSFFTSAGWAPDGVVRALDTGAGEFREIRLYASLREEAVP